jgi:DNA recombination protein RmuC
MNLTFQIAVILLGLLNLVLVALLLRRRTTSDFETLRPHFDSIVSETRRAESSLRDEFARQRDQSIQSDSALRESLENSLRQFGDSTDTRLSRLRQELNESATQTRSETRQGFSDFQTSVRTTMSDASTAQGKQLTDFSQRLDKLSQTLSDELEKIRQSIQTRLTELQANNEQKLEQMRATVDEKLQGTLNSRLGEHFKIVSERLELVHKGLGEMQAMANSVGDLKRVLTNVKIRGTWGEIQLGALLEQVLIPDQFSANVTCRPGSLERVEYAIKLPGRSDGDTQVWLPIDAKFPHEDYQRLVEASEKGDADAVTEAGKALEVRLRAQAKEIRNKYIVPPHTTDFAILFLPSEGLYAEALRRPGLSESLQQDCRVVLAGPTTLGALLNSLQMGFRTLAIQQRSSEVWKVLAAVKDEFGKFGDVLSKVKKKLDEASNQIDQTQVRTRAINKQLRQVEELPSSQGAALLPSPIIIDDELTDSLDEADQGILRIDK